MEKDFDQVLVEFNNRARSTFYALYERFQHSTASIDRERNENVYQQLLGKYVQELKQQLDSIAKELISQYRMTHFYDSLQDSLPFIISNYSTEFIQKAKSI